MPGAHENSSRTEPIAGSSDRAFGFVFAVFFALVGLWPLLGGDAPRTWALVLGAATAMLAITAPAVLAGPNRIWTKFGLLLHRIVNPLVMAALFFLVITPFGLVMRAFGKDPLRRKRDPEAPSYWIRREPPGPSPESMSNQF